MKAALAALLVVFQVLEIRAFVPNGGASMTALRAFPLGFQKEAHYQFPSRHGSSGAASTELYSSNEGKSKKKNKGLDENLRNKLVTESIAPWRTVRLFLYFSCGSGALIGGLITLTGFIAALSNGKEDLNVNTEVRTQSPREEAWMISLMLHYVSWTLSSKAHIFLAILKNLAPAAR
jgi:hypothetical protein